MKRQHYILSALMLILLGLPGCAAMETGTMTAETNMTVDEHELRGDRYAKQGQSEMAFVEYNKVLAVDPDNVRVRHKKAELLVHKGINKGAMLEYEYLLEHYPAHSLTPRVHLGLGKVYYRSNLPEESLAHMTKAVSMDPNLWQANSYIGVIHNSAGRFAEAEKAFSAALKIVPSNGELMNNLALTYTMSDQNRKAARLFQRALHNGAPKVKVCNNLGLTLCKLGKYDEALQAFQMGAGEDSEAKAYNNVGFFLFSKGEYDQAIEYLEMALELSPGFYHRANENLDRAKLAQKFQSSSLGKTNESSVSKVTAPKSSEAAQEETPLKLSHTPAPVDPLATPLVTKPAPEPVQEKTLPEQEPEETTSSDKEPDSPLAEPVQQPAADTQEMRAETTEQTTQTSAMIEPAPLAATEPVEPEPVTETEPELTYEVDTHEAEDSGLRWTMLEKPRKKPATTATISNEMQKQPEPALTAEEQAVPSPLAETDNAEMQEPEEMAQEQPADESMAEKETIPMQPKAPMYGIHVSSWVSLDGAKAHVSQLEEEGYLPHIVEANLGKKGIWYRVTVGEWADVSKAKENREQIGKKFKIDHPQVLKIETE